MLKPLRLSALLLALGLLSACANAPVDPDVLPSSLSVNSDVKLPRPVSIGIYMPISLLRSTDILRGQVVQFGRFTGEGVDAVARRFFTKVVHRAQPTQEPIQLMLDLDPSWGAEAGKGKITMKYRLFDAQGTELLSGTKSELQPFATEALDVMFKNLAIKVTQQIMVEIVNSSAADQARTSTTVSAFPARLLINESEPYRIGTGTYINPTGQVLTASYVTRDCLRIDVSNDASRRTGTVVADSPLLNLSVLNTAALVNSAVSLATAKPPVSTATTIAYYHWPKDGKPTRAFAFGNVVAQEGVAGAFGVFQFSSATKPMSYSSPILDAEGRLVGVFSGGYAYDHMHKRGVLNPNTYQGLSVEHVAEFLRRNRIGYSTAKYPDQLPVVDRSTAAAVQVSCYQ